MLRIKADFHRNHETNSGMNMMTDADDEFSKQKLDRPKTYRKYICGEEALKIPASQPYTLYRPMCRGRLNISSKYSMQQVCYIVSLCAPQISLVRLHYKLIFWCDLIAENVSFSLCLFVESEHILERYKSGSFFLTLLVYKCACLGL